MFFLDLLFAFLIALLLAWIFGSGFREQNNSDFIFFFILLMLFTWAGGIWIAPVGPLLWGIPWLSFLFVGLFFTILIIAITPDNHYRRKRSSHQRVNDEKAEGIFILDIFLWMLIIALVLSILFAYIW